MTELCRKRR